MYMSCRVAGHPHKMIQQVAEAWGRGSVEWGKEGQLVLGHLEEEA